MNIMSRPELIQALLAKVPEAEKSNSLIVREKWINHCESIITEVWTPERFAAEVKAKGLIALPGEVHPMDREEVLVRINKRKDNAMTEYDQLIAGMENYHIDLV